MLLSSRENPRHSQRGGGGAIGAWRDDARSRKGNDFCLLQQRDWLGLWERHILTRALCFYKFCCREDIQKGLGKGHVTV